MQTEINASTELEKENSVIIMINSLDDFILVMSSDLENVRFIVTSLLYIKLLIIITMQSVIRNSLFS